MIYYAAVDKVYVYVNNKQFWNAYRVNTTTRRISYYVNESGDPFDKQSPLLFDQKRHSLVRASVVVPRGKLKITTREL